MPVLSLLVPALLAFPEQLSAAKSPAVSVPPVSKALPVARHNDNRAAAGELRGNVLTLRLVVQWTSWTLNTATARDVPMLAFAEEGRAPQIPGPVLRVPLGTSVRVSLRNPLSDVTLTVRGLSSHATDARDSLVIAPGATVEHVFAAEAAGTLYYWGTISSATTPQQRFGFDSQLNGAIVVDEPGASRDDRIFILTLWSDSTQANGGFRFDREFWAINGRAWPETDRLDYAMGDSIRWRVINASADNHPMHLHGFYYRVDARGARGRDTVYSADQRRMVVTEHLRPGQTMLLTWSPDRPGGWVFHCHMTVHLMMPGQLTGQPVPAHSHDPQKHTEQGMAGLIIGINVRPAPGAVAAPPSAPHRHLRLFVNSDSTTADSAGRRFAFVIQNGMREPARDSMLLPGSPVILRRGEPTAITVINRSGEPTSIHWHGIELESYFDGVVGVGGMPGARSPAVLPQDSFVVHITPPRTGSFMYHTHFDDVRQQIGGLYAPFIVLEPGESWDEEHNRFLMVANDRTGDVVVNGSRTPAPLTMRSGRTYRLRIANITVANPSIVMSLVRDSVPVTWRALAKDGHDLPAAQARERLASQPISNGEIYDFSVTPGRAGAMSFEVRSGAGRLLVAMPVLVVP